MRTIPPRLSLGIAILMVAVGAHSVKAGTITTYTYTGNDFTPTVPPYPSGPYTTSDSVQGSFTIATLGDNLAFGTITPLTYNFSDGVFNLNQSNSTVNQFQVGTGGDGLPNTWCINVNVAVGNSYLETLHGCGFFGTIDDGNDYDGSVLVGFGAVGVDSGVWSAALDTSNVPEPSSLAMLATALALGGWRTRWGRSRKTRAGTLAQQSYLRDSQSLGSSFHTVSVSTEPVVRKNLVPRFSAAM
jgi:hypothetical protein